MIPRALRRQFLARKVGYIGKSKNNDSKMLVYHMFHQLKIKPFHVIDLG
jgi:hypothetical protein